MATNPDCWRVKDLISWATGYFNRHGVDAPRLTAELLLANVLKKDRISLYIDYDQPLTKKELAEYRELIKRRSAREPLAYILGTRSFHSIEVDVTPDVLVPRPETETLVEAALESIPGDSGQPKRILELGTGSGAVIISIASQRPGHLYFASDISQGALKVAMRNAGKLLGSGSVMFFLADWLSACSRVPGFDIIVTNPPYVRREDIESLEPEIRMHEPIIALDGGPDGLAAIRRIISEAAGYLVHGGRLLVEIGYDQAGDLEKISNNTRAFEPVYFFRDLAGYKRVACMIRL